jgi:hypothetical protein
MSPCSSPRHRMHPRTTGTRSSTRGTRRPGTWHPRRRTPRRRHMRPRTTGTRSPTRRTHPQDTPPTSPCSSPRRRRRPRTTGTRSSTRGTRRPGTWHSRRRTPRRHRRRRPRADSRCRRSRSRTTVSSSRFPGSPDRRLLPDRGSRRRTLPRPALRPRAVRRARTHWPSSADAPTPGWLAWPCLVPPLARALSRKNSAHSDRAGEDRRFLRPSSDGRAPWSADRSCAMRAP